MSFHAKSFEIAGETTQSYVGQSTPTVFSKNDNIGEEVTSLIICDLRINKA